MGAMEFAAEENGRVHRTCKHAPLRALDLHQNNHPTVWKRKRSASAAADEGSAGEWDRSKLIKRSRLLGACNGGSGIAPMELTTRHHEFDSENFGPRNGKLSRPVSFRFLASPLFAALNLLLWSRLPQQLALPGHRRRGTVLLSLSPRRTLLLAWASSASFASGGGAWRTSHTT